METGAAPILRSKCSEMAVGQARQRDLPALRVQKPWERTYPAMTVPIEVTATPASPAACANASKRFSGIVHRIS